MPLRVFLGVTFLYASLQKLANPNYLRAGSPTSVVAQMKALESSSPIGPLLRVSLHAPTLVGLLIAIGELAVALGLLAGLWTRLAAVGGLLLSLTFFLTVSWATTPYFYGSDIVFVFAWSVFVTCGAGGVLSLDAWIEARAARSIGGSGRPFDETRRRILIGARSTALLAGLAGVLGGTTAIVGRAVGGTRCGGHAALPPRPTSTDGASNAGQRVHRAAKRHHSASGSPSSPSTQRAATGTALFPASAVAVGRGKQFSDPASGRPAWLLRPSSSTVVAFSAVCTHAGCTVGYDASASEFVCPCHGGRFSARTGAVLGGPPPAPLSHIPARIVNDEVRVD
jgi:thiosulfate dehydrogenase [quinone] large subunit